jgi:hypothetical protein
MARRSSANPAALRTGTKHRAIRDASGRQPIHSAWSGPTPRAWGDRHMMALPFLVWFAAPDED